MSPNPDFDSEYNGARLKKDGQQRFERNLGEESQQLCRTLVTYFEAQPELKAKLAAKCGNWAVRMPYDNKTVFSAIQLDMLRQTLSAEAKAMPPKPPPAEAAPAAAPPLPELKAPAKVQTVVVSHNLRRRVTDIPASHDPFITLVRVTFTTKNRPVVCKILSDYFKAKGREHKNSFRDYTLKHGLVGTVNSFSMLFVAQNGLPWEMKRVQGLIDFTRIPATEWLTMFPPEMVQAALPQE